MPDRSSREYFLSPSGHEIPVEPCEEPIRLLAQRGEARVWTEHFPVFYKEWLLTWIVDSPLHGYLHAALARMVDQPRTGGLLSNLREAREKDIIYRIQRDYKVAICGRDPAFEGGPHALRKSISEYRQGLIAMPPCLVRLNEIEQFDPPVELILLPPSPLMSNRISLQLATPALVKKSSLVGLKPKVYR